MTNEEYYEKHNIPFMTAWREYYSSNKTKMMTIEQFLSMDRVPKFNCGDIIVGKNGEFGCNVVMGVNDDGNYVVVQMKSPFRHGGRCVLHGPQVESNWIKVGKINWGIDKSSEI